MDERRYIEQNQESWQQFSESLEMVRKRGAGKLTKDQLKSLGGQYRAVVSDLSFANSQGASDNLVGYLNELAGRAHGVIYAARPARINDFVSFVARDFPALFRSSISYIIVATFIFFAGWGLSASNPKITDAVLPIVIPKQASSDTNDRGALANLNPALTSSFIMTNNIQVGFKAFAGGITCGAYTVHELWYNGLVIGAVATKAAPVSGPLKFWALILPHGVIELLAIFICGGAGLMIGAAIIAPGNLRRTDALRITGMKAVKLLGGAVIFFVIAGIIEGCITPSALPPKVKLAFAGLTALALIIYLGFCGRTKPAEQL